MLESISKIALEVKKYIPKKDILRMHDLLKKDAYFPCKFSSCIRQNEIYIALLHREKVLTFVWKKGCMVRVKQPAIFTISETLGTRVTLILPCSITCTNSVYFTKNLSDKT